MINKNKFIYIFILFFAAFSCDDDTFELDLTENPNSLSVSSTDPDFLLNTILLNGAGTNINLSNTVSALVRHSHQFGPYTGQFSSTGLGATESAWYTTYSTISNTKLLSEIADSKELPHYKGIAQIMEALSVWSLVDVVGDVVYSQAVTDEYDQPMLDDDAQVYMDVLALLDEAIVNLNTSSQFTPEDLFYNGDVNKWIKLANTIKLIMYIQTRLVEDHTSEINEIINSGNYINELSDDFQLEYSTSIAPSDSRHFDFRANYLTGADDYINNYFMATLKDRFFESDPRLNYYFYRQTLEDPSGINLPCSNNANADLCYIGDGYWGRDHGDGEGIPPDGLLRTIPGVYTVGGAYDEGQGVSGPEARTLDGAGIAPVILSSYVDFLLAESSIMSGTTGDALDYLTAGIQKSMEKTFAFAPGNNTQADIDIYIDNVTDLYNAANSDMDKLDVVMKEFYIASYGASLLFYNAYRRTGLPSDLQDPVEEIGSFPRSLFLPNSEVNANVNISQKTVTDQIFWDNNPAGFIN